MKKYHYFKPTQFTPTQFDTAEDKAKFANHLMPFIAEDFLDTLFTKKFYTRLSMTFGHIAHFDKAGFYETWFVDLSRKVEFLKNILRHVSMGDPSFTYVDVERAVKGWLFESGLAEKYQARLAQAIEASERAELARLQA